MAWTTRTIRCGDWVADPIYAEERAGMVRAKPAETPCEVPRAVVGYFNTDEAILCRNRCPVRERPTTWDPGSILGYVSDEVGDALAAGKALGRDVVFTMAEWTDILTRYRKARGRLPEFQRVAQMAPAPAFRVKVSGLELKAAQIDPQLAAAGFAGYRGFGVGPAAAGAAVPAISVSAGAITAATSVVVAAAVVAAIYFYVSEAAELNACIEASKEQPLEKRAEFLDQCRRSGWPPWVKGAVGVAAVGVVGLLLWKRVGRS